MRLSKVRQTHARYIYCSMYQKACDMQTKLDYIFDNEKLLYVEIGNYESESCSFNISFVKEIVLIDD